MREIERKSARVAVLVLLLAASSAVGLAATTGALAAKGEWVQPTPEIERIEAPRPPAEIVEFAPDTPDVERLEQMIRGFRLARLAQELRLEEEDAARMAVRMREIEEKRKEIDAIRDSILPEIHEEIAISERIRRKVDEARLQYLITRMQEQTAEHQMELQKLEHAMQEALSVEQQARMLLFQKEFQEEMQHMLQMAQEARTPNWRTPRPPRAGAPPIAVPGPSLRDISEPESVAPSPAQPEPEDPGSSAPEPEKSDSR